MKSSDRFNGKCFSLDLLRNRFDVNFNFIFSVVINHIKFITLYVKIIDIFTQDFIDPIKETRHDTVTYGGQVRCSYVPPELVLSDLQWDSSGHSSPINVYTQRFLLTVFSDEV